MPRRTPTAILEARGSFIGKPSRRRPNEPMTDRPIGPAPGYLSKEEKKTWKELVAQSLPGVLMQSDRLMLSLLCRLFTKFKNNKPMMASETAMLITLSGKFALNPADRSKVHVEKPKESKLALFIAKK
jgi:phage terminase small subunit